MGLGTGLSPRLAAIVEALPLRAGMRVLEIGCGPGALARAIAMRIGAGHVLGIDRSGTAIAQARAAALRDGIDPALLAFRQAEVERFVLAPGEDPFDLAVAIRVGVLDGRHPDGQAGAVRAIAAALVPEGVLLIDGGDPLRAIGLDRPARR